LVSGYAHVFVLLSVVIVAYSVVCNAELFEISVSPFERTQQRVYCGTIQF